MTPSARAALLGTTTATTFAAFAAFAAFAVLFT